MQALANELTRSDVEDLPYVTLLARLGEANRPPGGLSTIRQLIINCCIRPETSVLHAGCNAGFSSREIVRMTGCTAVGVDISPDMAAKAEKIARQEGLDRLHYRQADMRALPFSDNTFDLTFSAGALAFVDGHHAAMDEWIRVTRPYGLIADAELYYRETPPDSIRADVARIIGVEVPHYDIDYWPQLFDQPRLEPWYDFDGPVLTFNDAAILTYVRRLVAHKLPAAPDDVVCALETRLVETFRIFNANLSYMNYQIIVCRRVADDAEPALYA